MFVLAQHKPAVDYKTNFAPLFIEAGKGPKALVNVLGQVVPVDAMDEAHFGDMVAARYQYRTLNKTKDHLYVNTIIDSLQT